jgi:hypothetical protein
MKIHYVLYKTHLWHVLSTRVINVAIVLLSSPSLRVLFCTFHLHNYFKSLICRNNSHLNLFSQDAWNGRRMGRPFFPHVSSPKLLNGFLRTLVMEFCTKTDQEILRRSLYWSDIKLILLEFQIKVFRVSYKLIFEKSARNNEKVNIENSWSKASVVYQRDLSSEFVFQTLHT